MPAGKAMWVFNKTDATAAVPTDQFKGNDIVVGTYPSPLTPTSTSSVNTSSLTITASPLPLLGQDKGYTDEVEVYQ